MRLWLVFRFLWSDIQGSPTPTRKARRGKQGKQAAAELRFPGGRGREKDDH